jgi:hypothetical protein
LQPSQSKSRIAAAVPHRNDAVAAVVAAAGNAARITAQACKSPPASASNSSAFLLGHVLGIAAPVCWDPNIVDDIPTGNNITWCNWLQLLWRACQAISSAAPVCWDVNLVDDIFACFLQR